MKEMIKKLNELSEYFEAKYKEKYDPYFEGVVEGVNLALQEIEIDEEKHITDEVEELIESRSNGTYSYISNETGELIELLGTDTRWTYLFSMIANKLIRLKYCYQVEDSLLDIAGYAKLELQKLREEKGEINE